MNKDQVQGWIKEAAGRLRTIVGKATGNRTLVLKGRIGQIIGKTQSSYGHAMGRLRKRP